MTTPTETIAARAPEGRYQVKPALLTGLIKRGLTPTQANDVANGACPVCFRWHGAKACAELRVELMKA